MDKPSWGNTSWDDMEWLQGTVICQCKDLKALKEGGAVSTTIIHKFPDGLQGAGKKVLAQMTDLQNNYEDLREKVIEHTEELTRLCQELGVKQHGSSVLKRNKVRSIPT